MQHVDQPRLLLTVEEAGRRLSLSRTTIFRLLREGAISSVRIGNARRIPAESLQSYVRRMSERQAA
ncbi:helix-turn-helix domain-containing protein [Saccharopolyspora hirsuta]|uniref:Helix-turn-helix domain-containing protein n=2 Tax=Saccharopolyspora hirsuta TaxID=1837 RepID=A0A5M7BTJ1_SACHI|nr:helix-turn-helix domain-containing protein [Saccharopolyspora hirsuta]MBF6511096.1 excisionase family DNA-binding protein [Nocardia farcinica]